MYDTIIIGARVAGSATAMLLAKKGYKVLLLDKASFPSDTLSTHYIHAAGVSLLKNWGLLDRLQATGCPPMSRGRLDFGRFALEGSPPPAAGGVGESYAPRRTVLDKLLLDAAAEAGVEVRERYAIQELLADGNRVTGVRGRSESGAISTEQARITIGADGQHSLVARTVDAPMYKPKPIVSCAYYTYWSGVPLPSFQLFIRDRCTAIAFPTNDGLTCIPVCYAIADFPRIKMDIEGSYLRALDTTPLGPAVRAGKREERFMGTADLPNFFRKPYGPGWALVGDAGYHKDPLTAQGITDAFSSAELLSSALDDVFAGREAFDDALGGYERTRNEHSMAVYELTCQRAAQGPPSPEVAGLLAALQGNQEQIDRFIGIDAGTVRAEDFFSPENVAAIWGGR
jgi:flavin-dependent dehydrogenase